MYVRILRRELLSWLAAGAAFSCRSKSAGVAATTAAWGGLEVTQVTQMGDSERGGTVLVLLHGYGAKASDLLPLARTLQRPGCRIIVPAGPLAEGGARAWWPINSKERRLTDLLGMVPRVDEDDLGAARSAVQGVLKTVIQHYAPESLLIAGFSQGAMLALNVALAASPAVSRAAVLSGVLLADSEQKLEHPPTPRPAMFVAHGRADDRLPFKNGEQIKAALEASGFPVTFRPFDGGHEIPKSIEPDLTQFLFAAP